MALREGNEAVAIHQDIAERNVGRPRRTIVDIRPFSGKEEEGISEWQSNGTGLHVRASSRDSEQTSRRLCGKNALHLFKRQSKQQKDVKFSSTL